MEETTFQPEALIASATIVVVARPFVVGATALPAVLAEIGLPILAVTVIPFLSADVDIKLLLSPLIFNVPLSNNTSLLPVSPAYFKLTLLN